MKKYLLFIAMVAIVVSCQQKEEELQTVTIKNQYSLRLPVFLTKTDSLNDDASLQYQNRFKEFYVVVIDEPKADLDSLFVASNTLNNYSQLLQTNFKNGLEKVKISKAENSQINGCKAEKYSIEGVLETHPIYYEVAVIESGTHYYQIFAWTLGTQKEKYGTQMKAILASFKELNSRGVKKKRLPK